MDNIDENTVGPSKYTSQSYERFFGNAAIPVDQFIVLKKSEKIVDPEEIYQKTQFSPYSLENFSEKELRQNIKDQTFSLNLQNAGKLLCIVDEGQISIGNIGSILLKRGSVVFDFGTEHYVNKNDIIKN
jgi:hypothetical protein